jgi:thiol-disulfide isomerase/thioredoxin
VTPTFKARPVRLTLLAIAIALAVAPAALALAAAPDTSSSDVVRLEPMKYDAFRAHLARAGASNFKYTLVDAWASNCAPCKENFPHLIEMHHKYAPKGLQVISLSLDDTSDTKAVDSAKAFLRDKKATFLNVLLDEDFGVGYEKLEINAIPAVFLFGPDGKLVKKFTLDDPNHQFTYAQVEKEVDALLGAKPAATK